MKKQIVYIPTNDEYSEKFTEHILCDNQGGYIKNLERKEAYLFTPEELKQLLEDYTNRIIKNATAYEKCETFGNMDTYAAVDEDSITNQLPKFLKEIDYETFNISKIS